MCRCLRNGTVAVPCRRLENGPVRRRFVRMPFFGAVLAALTAVSVQASCGSSSCPIDMNALQSFGRFSLDLSYQSIDQDQPRIGTRKARIGEIPSDHDEIRTVNRLTTLQLAYAPSTRFQLALSAPFVSRSHQHLDTETQEIERWHFGDFGDAVVQARTRLFLGESVARPALWLTTGVKLPTGARHEAADDGEDAEVTITPGTGSTDALLGLAYEGGIVRETGFSGPLGHSTRIPYFAAVSVRMNGRGRDEYRRGRELQLNAGSEYPLRPSLHLLGQINARVLARDDVGHTDEDRELTGGRYLFVSPGIRVLFAHGSSAYGFVQLPVHQRVNGLQLTSKANYVIGLRQQF
jgi:hypothetical protein